MENNIRDSIQGVSYIGAPRSNTAMFVTGKVSHLLDSLEMVDECIVFAEEGMDVSESLNNKHLFVFSSNPQLDYIQFVEKLEQAEIERNSHTKYCLREPGYYCSETAKIGANAYIEPGCLIGHRVEIGNNAKVFSGAVIKNAVIGDDFICGENSSIGVNGFTMAENESGNKIRIPSLGGVRIGNHVEISALTNVARGTAGDTVLEDYVKLDALVHIGHDAYIHRNCELTAGVIVAGYAEIGEHTYVGVNTSIRNRITIGDGVFVGMGAAVTRDVDRGLTVAGVPAKKIK